MRFLHTADWHLGKELKGFSLVEEQKAALAQIEAIALEEKVDAIVIAGDIFDTKVSKASTLQLANETFKRWNLTDNFPLLVISGNHDSSQRLKTGREWFEKTNFYLNTELKKAFFPVEIADVQFFLLPYFEVSEVSHYFGNPQIKTKDEAMGEIVAKMKANFKSDFKQVLVAHDFFTQQKSNRLMGGLEGITTSCLKDFCYVALGHLHKETASINEKIKYSGSLFKYSKSELNYPKGVWIVDTTKQTSKFKELKPVCDLTLLEGSFLELTNPQFVKQQNQDNYTYVELTDTEPILNVLAQLRACYPKIVEVTRKEPVKLIDGVNLTQSSISLEPLDILQRFYLETNQVELSNYQLDLAKEALAEMRKEGSD